MIPSQWIQPGDRIEGSPLTSASTVNKILAATNWFNLNGGGRTGVSPPSHDGGGNSNLVNVKNDTTNSLPLGSVLEFDDYSLHERFVSQKFLWFTGKTPNLSRIGWGIYQLPTEKGRMGPAAVVGPCVARINILDTAHRYANLENNQTRLRSQAGAGPVMILANPSGTTGTKVVPVLIDRSSPPLAYMATAIYSTTGSQTAVGDPLDITSGGSGGTLSNGITNVPPTFTVTNAGLYHFGFQCSPVSNQATSGNPSYRIDVFKVNAADTVETLTQWRGLNIVGLTPSSGTISTGLSQWNICVNGIIELAAGEKIRLKNAGSVPISISVFSAWMRQLQ